MWSDLPPEVRPVREVMAELRERTLELRRLLGEAEAARARSSLLLLPVECRECRQDLRLGGHLGTCSHSVMRGGSEFPTPDGGELPVGQVVQHTVYDPKTGKSRCGACDRIVAVGQETCVCGARLIAQTSSRRSA